MRTFRLGMERFRAAAVESSAFAKRLIPASKTAPHDYPDSRPQIAKAKGELI
jgi:hypothetical protein